MDIKQKLQLQGGAVRQSPTLGGVDALKEEIAQDSQNTGEDHIKGGIVVQKVFAVH